MGISLLQNKTENDSFVLCDLVISFMPEKVLLSLQSEPLTTLPCVTAPSGVVSRKLGFS